MDPKFVDLVHSVIKVCEEAAKLTGSTWDDVVVDAIHQTFDKWFNIVHNAPKGATMDNKCPVRKACGDVMVVSLPPWVAALLQKLLPFILDIFTKAETALKIDAK